MENAVREKSLKQKGRYSFFPVGIKMVRGDSESGVTISVADEKELEQHMGLVNLRCPEDR